MLMSRNNNDPNHMINNLYATALKIRMTEEAIAREYPKAEMKSPIHLYVGQEAIASGVCNALTHQDSLFAYYRSHGWYLAKGGNLNRMMGELFCKSSGCSMGYGGSMHLIDLSVGFQGTTALVAAQMPHAVGSAFGMRYKKQPHVAVAVFGDGATEEGLFQESLMFATLRKLPVIFVSENNGLATNTWIKDRQPAIPIYKRAESLGVHSVQVDGNDAVAVYQAASQAVERARKGDGPSFIEGTTYRILEHCGPNFDTNLGFRTQAEVDEWRSERDPVRRLEQKVDKGFQNQIKKQYEEEIRLAFEEARLAPFPTQVSPGVSSQCLQ